MVAIPEKTKDTKNGDGDYLFYGVAVALDSGYGLDVGVGADGILDVSGRWCKLKPVGKPRTITYALKAVNLLGVYTKGAFSDSDNRSIESIRLVYHGRPRNFGRLEMYPTWEIGVRHHGRFLIDAYTWRQLC